MTVTLTRAFTPMAAEIPPKVDVDTVMVDLAADHVSVPEGKYDQAAPLQDIVADARAHGIPLSIVVVEGNPARESDLRDVATEVGKQEHGTVVVLSDSWVGTYSDHFTRARLEWAEDNAKYTSGHSSVAARIVVDHLETAEPVSWTAITCVLLVGTAVACGGLYVIKARRAAREQG
ncbi:hypothetical protein ABIA39_005785 [Nocardia sp. GAS34]|uniref:Rv1476 family membrane protein n=1 Tax=unclassified Nocardia TaxID=2637762 RepID=UPI003D1A0FAD